MLALQYTLCPAVSEKRYIDEYFQLPLVPPDVADELWAGGWRHQGFNFFRYSHSPIQGYMHEIVPVRIRVADFTPSKSQRRVLRKNTDLKWEISPAYIDHAAHEIFHRHSSRFVENVPESLYCFFTRSPADTPCSCLSFRAYLDGRLIAVSFMDVGLNASSSAYAIFDPQYEDRSLGTLTLLKELEHSRQLGMHVLYHGYGTREPSHYDYKLRFAALEMLDWETGAWQPTHLQQLRSTATDATLPACAAPPSADIMRTIYS
jgi:leucyl-tRNA---protein transferase